MPSSLGTLTVAGPLRSSSRRARIAGSRGPLRQLLQELHHPLRRATVVYCDNVNAVYLSTNPVQHERTKHVEIDLHFIRERVALGEVRVLHVPTTSHYANVFTTNLPTSVFTEFRSSLNVRGAPNLDCGECWNVIGLVGLSIVTPHLTYICTLTMPKQYIKHSTLSAT